MAQQLGLDSAVAVAQRSPERLGGELGGERFRPQRRQGAFVLVVDGNPDTAESADVAIAEHSAIVEPPPRTHVRIGEIGDRKQLASHAEVHDQLSVVIEVEQQELASPPNGLERRADRLSGWRELLGGVAVSLNDRAAAEPGRKLPANRLDLGQLGHGRDDTVRSMASAIGPDPEAFLDVLDAAAVLDELPDVARVEAWASSVLSVWAEAPDAAEIDAEFAAWLAHSIDPRAPKVLLAVSNLLALDPATVEAAKRQVDEPLAWMDGVGPARAGRAWIVTKDDLRSVGIGFEMLDGSEHSLLADVADGALVSLIVGPGPDELFDGSEDLISLDFMPTADAAHAIIAAGAATPVGQWPESGYVNAAIARRRLAELVGAELGGSFASGPPSEAAEKVDDERAELNQWALSVLDVAGVGQGEPGDAHLVEPLDPGATARYPEREREAFEALEWADWLGMVLGLSRCQPGELVEPSMLIDLINRCPEVTSSIPRNDRAYFEWAISMVLPLWGRAGVIDDESKLTATGAAHLVHALRAAWQC